MSYKPNPAAQYSGGSMEEALAGMAKVGSPRQPVGTSVPTTARNASASGSGKMVKRKVGSTTGDPTAAGTRKARANVQGNDRLGAHYGITARVSPPADPCAAPTQSSGRLLKSVTGRQSPDFWGAAGYKG